ncbi:MAG: hypothetical protein ACM3SY_13280 [Candidatus Omnitrophota bacterium]
MQRLYVFLQVRKIEVKPFWQFLFLNFFLMGGAFLVRAVRDALFYSYAGPKWLPMAFMINAVILYVFSVWMPKLLNKVELRKLLCITFVSAMLVAIGFGFFFRMQDAQKIPRIWYFLLFCVVETVIFLSLQLFGALVDARFTPKQLERLFPKFVGGGHIGITAGGLVAVFAARQLGSSLLLLLWGLLLLCCVIMIRIIFRGGTKDWPSLNQANIETTTNEKVVQEKPNVKEESGIGVILKSRYAKLFAIVTVCTFFVGALFDFSLANTATQFLGPNADQLAVWFGYITIAFGVVAFLVQFTAISKLIRKLGVERTNLFAPALLSVGAAGLSIYSFYTAALARFFYLINEFVFNQTLIQFIYGAESEATRQKVRYTTEGAITFFTIGFAGLFLLIPAYVPGFQPGWVANIAFIFAIGMLVFSIFLIPEYRKKVALRAGGDPDSQILQFTNLLDQAAKGGFVGSSHFLQKCLISHDPRVILSAVDTIKDAGIVSNFISTLRDLAFHKDTQVRVAALDALSAAASTETFEQLRPILHTFNDSGTIRSLGSLYLKAEKTIELMEDFNLLLKSEDMDIRTEVMRLFVRTHHLDALTSVAGMLNGMFTSEISEERQAAAEILGLLESSGYSKYLLNMAENGATIGERKEALRTLGKVAYGSEMIEATLKLMFGLFKVPDLDDVALKGARQIFQRFPHLTQKYMASSPAPSTAVAASFQKLPPADQLFVLTDTKGAEIDRFIIDSLCSESEEIRKAALIALNHRIEDNITALDLLYIDEIELKDPVKNAFQQTLSRLCALNAAVDTFKSRGKHGFPLLLNEVRHASEAERNSLNTWIKLLAYSDSNRERVKNDLIKVRRHDRLTRDEALASLEQCIRVRDVYRQFQAYEDAVDFENSNHIQSIRNLAQTRDLFLGDNEKDIIANISKLGNAWLTSVAQYEAGQLTDKPETDKIEKLKLISSIPLFTNMPGAAFLELISDIQPHQWKKGDHIADQDQPCKQIFIFHSGILIQDRLDDPVTVKAPLAAGVVEVFSQKNPFWYETLVAESDVQGWAIPAERFLSIIMEYPTASKSLAGNLISMIVNLNERINQSHTEAFATMKKLDDSIQKFLTYADRKNNNEFDSIPTKREYKFLADVDPEQLKLPGIEEKKIEQFYIVVDPEYEVRLRCSNNTYYMTIKGKGTLSREEVEVTITADMFEACRPLCRGQVISKSRYIYPYLGNKWKIDIYDSTSGLAQLEVAEVEVPVSEKKPKMPPGLRIIEDVSDNASYKNKNLALVGLPRANMIQKSKLTAASWQVSTKED